jgi:peptidoglycan/xylan/chitin deacetylase (PgdA/CDA1 family)
MGGNVGSIITLFGAGTGLSDADREYAKIMAGGDVNLTEDALRKILLINEVQSRYAIEEYNKSVKKVAPELMAEVPPPSSEYTSYIKDFKAGKVKGVTDGSAPLRPDATPARDGRAAAPPAAVNFLRQNDTPENRQFFDRKYGVGASRSALGR